MNEQFEQFIHIFIKQYKVDIFNNISQCKSLLLDHAKGEYKKEIRLLLQALELGCFKAILSSNDLNLTRISLINQLQNEYYINENISSSIIDLLLSILRGYKYHDVETIESKQENTRKEKISKNVTTQSNIHDYENEAKAQRFYQTAINCFFKDISNNFTLAIGSILKAIKLCPSDKRFHYYLSYCFYKANDNNSLNKEINILKELVYDNHIKEIFAKDILSAKNGKIAGRLYNSFALGGEGQRRAAMSSIYREHRMNYMDQDKIFYAYMDFINWADKFEKNI